MKAKKITQKNVIKQFLVLTILTFLLTNLVFAQPQNCLDLTSDYDRLYFPTPISGTDDFTLEAWFKSDNNTGSNLARLFTWWGNGSRFEVGDRNGLLQIFVYNNNSGSQWINTNVNIVDGNWHFVSITRENNFFKVYVDGVLEDTHSIELLMNNNLSVGHWNSTLVSQSQWIGRVDEIRLWDIVRTESEIQSTMNTELCGDKLGLVVYLDFNQGIAGGDNSGLTTAIDKTGNGFDGVLLDFFLFGNTSNWVSSPTWNSSPCGLLPEAAFTIDNGTGCAPLIVQFFDESESEIDSWNWSFPGGTPSSSTEQNPEVVYESPGIFDVTLEVTNVSGSNVIIYEELIFVGLQIFAGFDYSVNENTVEFTNNSLNASTFSWNFGDGSPLSFEENPTHTYNQSGVYLVTLVTSNPYCGSGITQNVYVFSAGTEKLKNDILIEIAPNPFQDQASIQIELDNFRDVQVEIYSSTGQLIESFYSESNTIHEIRVGKKLTSNGLYFAKIRIEDSFFTKKLLRWKNE